MSTPQRQRKPRLGSVERPRTCQLPRGVSVKTIAAMMRVMPTPTKEEVNDAARWWFSDHYLPNRVHNLLGDYERREHILNPAINGFDVAVCKFHAAWEAVWEQHRRQNQSSTNK